MIPLIVWAINSQSTWHQTTTVNQEIPYYNSCYDVRHTWGSSYFVPTKTEAEWDDFVDNHPGNILIEACVISCRVGYQFRNDQDTSQLRRTPYTDNAPVYRGGGYSVETSTSGDNDDTCNASNGCGVRHSVQCQSGAPANIRVWYAYQASNSSGYTWTSAYAYTPWTTGDASEKYWPWTVSVTSWTNDHECHPNNGGCRYRMIVETDNPNYTCSIKYRHRNDAAEAPFATDGAWSTFSNSAWGGEECNGSPWCGVDVQLYCDWPGTNWSCWWANGNNYQNPSQVNNAWLCASWTASPASVSWGWPWSWVCLWADGGANPNCSANYAAYTWAATNNNTSTPLSGSTICSPSHPVWQPCTVNWQKCHTVESGWWNPVYVNYICN